jgi:hypothetical protein
LKFCFIGIDTVSNCDTNSNLDFVHFIWHNLERVDFVKHCMTLVRRDYLSLPELLCLKHYLAESGGWRTDVNCRRCIAKFHSRIRNILPSRCLQTGECKCMVCTRQPPSLLGLASHNLFQLIHNLGRFTLSRETTYGQYVLAVRSKKTPIHQLLPPEFPNIRLVFQCTVFAYKLHLHCPGLTQAEAWKTTMEHTFQSEGEAILSLTALERVYWCRHCKRGLFFHSQCHRQPSTAP